MITIEKLLAAGYKGSMDEEGLWSFNKDIFFGNGVRMFRLYFARSYVEARMFQEPETVGLSREGKTYFDLKLFYGKNATIKKVERFFMDAHESMMCKSDDREIA